MKHELSLTQAIEGFILNLNARHLSQHTINDYSATFRKFLAFLDHDPPIASITQHDIETFLASQKVSKKTVLNYHTGLSSLWTWATAEGITNEHIVSKVPRPKPEKRIIKPYSEEEIRAMLKAISHTRYYTRPGKKESRHSLHHSERNRAVILVLLDTGMRASELCELHIHHLDLKDQIIRVYGKGDKERIIPICARTAKALWRYLATRPDDTAGDYLFVNLYDDPLTRDRLLKSLKTIGRRAGVRGVNCHRFRHTFAITFLRNGGDPWTLQMLLGHSTMDMVKTYLLLANTDLTRAHKQASPVDNWRL